MQSSGRKWDDFSAVALGKKRGERRERKPPQKKKETRRDQRGWMEERGDFLSSAGRDLWSWARWRGEGVFLWGDRGKKKAREDRVNEMASKDELNCGRKETRSGLALLIDSSQTHSFQPQSLNSSAQLFKRPGVWGVWVRGCIGGNRLRV